MIDFLKGRVAHLETDYIVLDVHGVGYRVFCPNPYRFAKSDDTVTVYTHHHVREDAILLFGFETREEQRLFRRLLDVSGIGPRVALGILAGGRPETVVAAVQQENLTFLTKLPGIGKKTAQRIILDLKDKLDHIGLGSELGALSAGYIDDPASAAALRDGGPVWGEVREALKALGYTDAELDRAWHEMKNDVPGDENADALMKRALKLLYRG